MIISKNTLLIGGISLALLLLILVVGTASVHNAAISYDQTAQEQQSAISVQLQRRNDLIKSLVSTVDAAGKFEKSTLTDVIEMRKNVSTGKLDSAMLNVNALTEAYPEIKTTQAYVQLMTELSVTENLIGEQRKTYNGSVRSYQSFIQSFPNNILLGLSGYQKQDYKYLDLQTPEYNPDIFKK